MEEKKARKTPDEAKVRALSRPNIRFNGQRVHVSTYLPADVAALFVRLADAEGMSQAHATRSAIADWMVAQAKKRKSSKKD